jgi:carboxyl-terminal processing protease
VALLSSLSVRRERRLQDPHSRFQITAVQVPLPIRIPGRFFVAAVLLGLRYGQVVGIGAVAGSCRIRCSRGSVDNYLVILLILVVPGLAMAQPPGTGSLSAGPSAAQAPASATQELSAADNGAPVAQRPVDPVLSPQARAYLRYALDIMQTYSINRDRIDWPDFRNQIMRRADGAVHTEDTHAALRDALRALGDGHSFLRGGSWPDRAASTGLVRTRNPWMQLEHRQALLDGIGYLAVPAFPRGTHAMQQQYAAEMQEGIRALSGQVSCGWIVDLRGNTGGTFWPMLTGTGPLLGDGEWAAAVHADGQRTRVWYRDGQSGLGDHVQLRVFEPVREPHLADMPVAVLIGPATASAGEAVAIVFGGRDRARSFGEPTRGVSTVNQTFPLGDGAVMALTVAATADRLGRIHQHAIDPDVSLPLGEPDDPLHEQPVVIAAMDWLETMSACS